MKESVKRASRLSMVIVMCLLVGQTVFATTPAGKPAAADSMEKKVEKLGSKTIPVGKIQRSKQSLKIGDIDLPTYECMNVSYLLVSDLRQVGGNISWDSATGKTVIYDLKQPIKEEPKFELLAENSIAYLGRDTVYINYQEVPAIFVQGKALIPAKWIPVLFSSASSNPFQIVKRNSQWSSEENTDEIDINGINIWFDGEKYIEEPYIFPVLQLGEQGYYKDFQYDLNPDYIYVGFIISEIDGIVNNDIGLHKAWLKNPTYYTIPVEVVPKPIRELFPQTIVRGVMRYASGGFAKGEEVIINRATDGKLYHLQGENGKIIQVPWGSVSVKKSPVTKEQATNEQIEQHINKQDIASKTSYLVWTDLYRQRTYIFQGKQNNWKLTKNLPSSTGRDITPTPTGRYTLNRRVPAFGYGKGYLAKNAYAFIGGEYLYHSVLYDQKGDYLLEGRGVLGTKASQGCIRFSPEESVWFYNTMPIGTAVYIN